MAEHQLQGRREDTRLITGRGHYTADHAGERPAAAYFLRSDRAHAKIVRIDSARAQAAPGVLGILTGADFAAADWKGLPAMAFFKGVGGSVLRVPARYGLAHGRVRFVGEPVAIVVAPTEAAALQEATTSSLEIVNEFRSRT